MNSLGIVTFCSFHAHFSEWQVQSRSLFLFTLVTEVQIRKFIQKQKTEITFFRF